MINRVYIVICLNLQIKSWLYECGIEGERGLMKKQ